MKRTWIVFCLIALLVTSASSQHSDLKSTSMEHNRKSLEKREKLIMEKILKIEDSAMEEWRQGNPMKWIEISADDVIYIDPGLTAPIVGKKAYI